MTHDRLLNSERGLIPSTLLCIMYQPSLNQRELTREFSSNFKATFYPCSVFRQPCRLPDLKVHSAAAGLLTTALYRLLGNGKGKADNSIVYDFYALAARWTVHAKNLQLADLIVIIKSLIKLKLKWLAHHSIQIANASSIVRGWRRHSGERLSRIWGKDKGGGGWEDGAWR